MGRSQAPQLEAVRFRKDFSLKIAIIGWKFVMRSQVKNMKLSRGTQSKQLIWKVGMKPQKDPKLTVLQFNESINNQDIEGLSKLMARDYTFVDSSDEVHTGKARNLKGWSEFFNQFPDYINHFSTVASKGNQVLVTGYSTCSDDRLDGPAIWTAKVENELVAEWRVYLDTPENRKVLDLPVRK